MMEFVQVSTMSCQNATSCKLIATQIASEVSTTLMNGGDVSREVASRTEACGATVPNTGEGALFVVHGSDVIAQTAALMETQRA